MAISEKIDDIDQIIEAAGNEIWYTMPTFYHIEFLDKNGHFAGFFPGVATTKKEAEQLIVGLKARGREAIIVTHIN